MTQLAVFANLGIYLMKTSNVTYIVLIFLSGPLGSINYDDGVEMTACSSIDKYIIGG
ncbi:MAG: hypothetical protein AAF149_13565 [Bacteroidota bacterium]